MVIKYTILYNPQVVKKDIPAIDNSIKLLIKKAIEDKLAINPISFGKPLRYSLKGHRRLRVGDYRIVFSIENDKKIVIVQTIQHRKNVYNQDL